MPPAAFYPRAAGATLGQLFGQEASVTQDIANSILANRAANMREQAFRNDVGQQDFQNSLALDRRNQALAELAQRATLARETLRSREKIAEADQGQDLLSLVAEGLVLPEDIAGQLTPEQRAIAIAIRKHGSQQESGNLKAAVQQAKAIQDSLAKNQADLTGVPGKGTGAVGEVELSRKLAELVSDTGRVREEPGWLTQLMRSLYEPAGPIELPAERLKALGVESGRRSTEANKRLAELTKRFGGTDPIAAMIASVAKNQNLSDAVTIDPATGAVSVLPMPRKFMTQAEEDEIRGQLSSHSPSPATASQGAGVRGSAHTPPMAAIVASAKKALARGVPADVVRQQVRNRWGVDLPL